MAIFHSYVRLPEAINFHILWLDGSKRLDSLQLSTVGMLRPSISLEFNVNCNGNHPNFALFQDSKLHTYIYIYYNLPRFMGAFAATFLPVHHYLSSFAGTG